MASREVHEKSEGFYEKARQNPKVWIGLGILLAIILLIWLPPWRVSHFGINNATVEADLENQYRATLAQILGGVAVAAGIYFAWKNFQLAQVNLKSDQEKFQKNFQLAQEGQITERFTRAVEQLGAVNQSGNSAIEIRLGGIYALERVANESDKDYWPVMEILTAYVRKNSQVEKGETQDKVSLDIQAILTIIGRRKYFFSFKESNGLEYNRLDLKKT